ncbi:MAG TPA: GFA family protein [Thermoleophilaceae bacterium]|nr:GFA family protein [Thermoleophilaceae bacterium]
MPDSPQPLTGRCLCGGVTYKIDAEPMVQAVCHCTDCQRQTGNPFSVIVAVPRDALTVEGDTIATYATVGEDHGQDTERSFCSACGSPVFSMAAVMPDMAFVKAGSLDDSSWLEPAVEVWTQSAQPWSPPFEGTTRMDRGPA